MIRVQKVSVQILYGILKCEKRLIAEHSRAVFLNENPWVVTLNNIFLLHYKDITRNFDITERKLSLHPIQEYVFTQLAANKRATKHEYDEKLLRRLVE